MHMTSVRDRLREKGFRDTSVKPIMIELAPTIFDSILLERNASRRSPVTVQIKRHDFIARTVEPESSGVDHARDFYVEGVYRKKSVRAYFIGTSSKNGLLSQVFIEHMK